LRIPRHASFSTALAMTKAAYVEAKRRRDLYVLRVRAGLRPQRCR